MIRVNFPANARLTAIGDYAFGNCSSLTELSVPNSVKTIGNRAFSKCTALSRISLPEGIIYIGEYAFNRCESLASIALPDSLVTISDKLFYRCTALSQVEFGNSVTSVGSYAFYNCSGLTDIRLPDSVKNIGNYAFKGCSGLRSVVLKKSVENVGNHIFSGCSSLTVYTDNAERPENWEGRWNSGYRPVIWGCTLSEEGYVVSFTKNANTVSYLTAKNGVSEPRRDGFTFGGWSATVGEEEVIYTVSELADVPDGTVLTAVWVPAGTQE